MTREIVDSGKQGTYGGEDSFYPNEGFIACEKVNNKKESLGNSLV